MLHRRNIAENPHLLLSRRVRMFEYCVVKNVENIKVFEILNAYLSGWGKTDNIFEFRRKKYYQNHTCFFLRQKRNSFFFLSDLWRDEMCYQDSCSTFVSVHKRFVCLCVCVCVCVCVFKILYPSNILIAF